MLYYIRTARSKGLSEFIVLFKHVLRNSIIPFVTLIGLSFAKMIGGMVIVEKVFNIRFATSEITGLNTVGELVQLIEKKSNK